MTEARKKLIEVKNVSLTFNKGRKTRLRLLIALALTFMRGKYLALLGNQAQARRQLVELF